jgi:hypothetical protein
MTSHASNRLFSQWVSTFLLSVLRRDSTSHDLAIHVGTPSRGSAQRINTKYAAKAAMNQNQSGISSTSILIDRHEAAYLYSATSGGSGFRFAVARDAPAEYRPSPFL